MYSLDTVYLKPDKPSLRVNAKFGALGQAWIDVELPADFYDCIMKLVNAEIAAHEQKMRAHILAQEQS